MCPSSCYPAPQGDHPPDACRCRLVLPGLELHANGSVHAACCLEPASPAPRYVCEAAGEVAPVLAADLGGSRPCPPPTPTPPLGQLALSGGDGRRGWPQGLFIPELTCFVSVASFTPCRLSFENFPPALSCLFIYSQNQAWGQMSPVPASGLRPE